jgi:hypothetical protein
MRVHATKQARYDHCCTRLEEVARKAVNDEKARARPIVIAYGAGEFSSTLKHNWPVPTTRLRRELERLRKVVLVDEHRTSSFHYESATRLRDIYRMSDGRFVRGVQWCDATNTLGCMPFTHRDANAAMNIRWCLLCGAPRPLHFLRGHPKLRGEPAVVDPAVTVPPRACVVDALVQAHDQAILPAGHKHPGGRPGSTRRGASNGRVRPCTLR